MYLFNKYFSLSVEIRIHKLQPSKRVKTFLNVFPAYDTSLSLIGSSSENLWSMECPFNNITRAEP